ncbi:MAG: cadherin domain-containing protein [Reichenbachiella sp.]|uniref:cadherin domain-containing protein n=1 Tax=Reichenbachiella sp. TaxID=2184521 RepID=UPI003263C21C
MKKGNLYCLLFLFMSFSGFAQNEFISTWKTDNTGTSSDTEITIPMVVSSGSYSVDWNNDGTPDETGITGSVTHDFVSAGTYTIRITATTSDAMHMSFSNGGDRLKITDISQWGNIKWATFNNSFFGCANLDISATDAPDLTADNNQYAEAFMGCTSLTGGLSNWDMSGAVITRNMFNGATSYNENISGWTVSSVTLFSGMFQGATSFNQNISSWTISSGGFLAFNNMFNGATSFNQNLGAWNMVRTWEAPGMLANSGMSVTNYDATLLGWSSQTLAFNPPRIPFSAANVYYCDDTGRAALIASGWPVTDGGPDPADTDSDLDGIGDACDNIVNASLAISAPSASTTEGEDVTYTITYSNAASITLADGDITVNTTGDASATAVVSGSGPTTRTVTLTSIGGTNGTFGISIAAGTADNATANGPAVAIGPSQTFAFADADGDGVFDSVDSCPNGITGVPDASDPDLDGDGCKNSEDSDDDGDGVDDATDNCPLTANADQLNTDGSADGGNVCDVDDDNDGIYDEFEIELGTNPLDASSVPMEKSIVPVGATASSQFNAAYPPTQTIGSSNLNAAGAGTGGLTRLRRHAAVPNGAGMWLSANDGLPITLTYDMGAQGADMDGAYFWNYNQNNFSTFTPGINAFTMEYASVDDPTNFISIGDYNLAAADGVNPVAAQLVSFSSLGDVRYIKITINSNHGGGGFAGLSKIRFQDIDSDGDGMINSVDTDDDGDGILDAADNCRLTVNADQADADLDGVGNVCDNIVNASAVIGAPVYDGTDITYTVTYSNANSITISDADVTVNASGDGTATATVSGTGSTTRTVTLSSISGSTGNIGISLSVGTADNATADGPAAAVGPSATIGFQSITFGALEDRVAGGVDFDLAATGGASGNDVTYASSNSSVATVSGSTVTIVGAGVTNITASQAGNGSYIAAADVVQSLTVKGTQTITFNALANKTYGDATFTVGATGGDTGNPVTFAGDDASVATVSSSGEVTIISTGSVNITANQAGDASYAAADPVVQSLTVDQADLSVRAQSLDVEKNAGSLPAITFEYRGFVNSDGTDGDTDISGLVGVADLNTLSATAPGIDYTTAGNSYDLVPDLGTASTTNYNLVIDATQGQATIVDSPPVITLIGSATETVILGGTYTDPGATASDLVDGDLTASVVTTNPVDVNTSGSYTVRYNVTDGSGNVAVEVTRTVEVGLTSEPGLHLDGQIGSYDYISVPDDASLDFTNAFTYEAWVNFDQITVSNAGYGWRSLFAKSRYTESYGLMVYAPDGTLRFYHDGFGTGITDYNWSGTLAADAWYHVAVTFDGTKTAIYIDGVEVSSQTAAAGSLTPNNNVLKIGISGTDPYAFDGSMDEVRFWNIARTEAEIIATKDAELKGSETGLVLYYDFNEGVIGGDNTALTTIKDRSLNGNDGDLVGFALTGAAGNFVSSGHNRIATPYEDQVITFDALADKNFGNSDFALSATASSGLPMTSYSSSNTAVATVLGSTVTIVGAGTTTITAVQDGGASHRKAETSQSLTVLPFATSIALNLPGSDSEYTGTGIGVTPTANDASSDPTLAILTEYSVEGANTFSTTLPVNAGTYDVRANLDSEPNYAAAEATGKLTIMPLSTTINLNLPGTNPVYSGAGQGISPTANDIDSNPTLVLATEYSVQGANTFVSTVPANAGVYDVRVNLDAAEINYSATEATGIYTIDKVTLDVRAQSLTADYNTGVLPTATFEYRGFVNGDGTDGATDISSLVGIADLNTIAVSAPGIDYTSVGSSYGLTVDVGTASSTNYDFQSDAVQGQATIVNSPPVITLLGDATTNVVINDNYVDAGATASDPSDGDITANIVTVNSVNTAVLGSYTVTYNVMDQAGQAAPEVVRTVVVVAQPNAPVVDNATFAIAEYTVQGTGSDNGTSVGTVVASDADGDNLSFAITTGNTDGAFGISNTGEITVTNRAAVDFETNPTFELVVTVTDDSPINQSGTATITINLNNISPNDFCTNAITVGVGTVTAGSTNDATNDENIAASCGGNDTSSSDGSVGVWYHIVGNGETIKVSTCSGSKYGFDDTSLSIYTGSCVSGLTCLGGNEDAGIDNTCGSSGYQAETKFNSTLGVDYYILIDGYSSDAGDFDLTTSSTPTPAPPANDNCAQAEALTVFAASTGTATTGTNKDATNYSGVVNCDEYANINDVWYTFNSGPNTRVDVTTALVGAGSLSFEMYAGCGATEMSICGSTGTKQVSVTPNTDYVIQFWNKVADEGTFTVLVNDGPNTAATVSTSTKDLSRYSTDGDLVETVTVTDAENHSQLLSISAGNDEGIFAIDASGKITVVDANALSTSATATFTLTILAADQGPGTISSTGTTTINIIDNASPTITAETVALDENTANTTEVLTVTASDGDGDPLSFNIKSGNTGNAFTIDGSGIITVNDVNQLDFETNPFFALEVEVTGTGTLTLSSTAIITINLNDINEVSVVNAGTATIGTSMSAGEIVSTVTFTDQDTGQSHTFSISSGNTNSIFQIDAISGELSIADAAALSAGGANSYTLTIEVSDNGSPVQTGSNTMTVSAFVNNVPVIVAASLAIDENSANGTTVGTVQATDAENDNITFTIADGNGLGGFMITPAGEIQVANVAILNFEVNPVFNLTIKAQDDGAGNLSGFETVSINLNDVNETPVVSNTTFGISYQSANGLSVGSVTASDPENDALNYTITTGNEDGIFAINATTGEIAIASGSLLNPATKPTHTLTVQAADADFSPTGTFTINVYGNEFPALDVTTFNVDENTGDGTLIATLSSSDASGIKSFEIVSGNESGAFAFDAVSHQLTINKSSELDYETVQQFTLQVKTTDNGLGNLQTTETVTISLNDINEFAPSVSSSVNAVNENTTSGTVAIVSATDDDVLQTLSYSIASGNTGNAFSINNSGMITISNASALDFETNPSFNLTVDATDSGTPSNTTSENLTINLTDVNEEPVLSAIGNQSGDELVALSFTAGGSDVDTGSSLTYSIDATSVANGMSIDALSGAFRWTPAEDQDGSHSATITVSDGTLEASETISITISEVNKAPVLASIGDHVTSEGVELTFTAIASDVDLPVNALTYSLDATSVSNGMTIDASSGAFNWTPDELQNGTYSVTVTVNDGVLETNETISITVSEVNVAPVLASIGDQNTDEGVELTFVASATDVDLPLNNLTYSLDATSISNGMTINASSGAFSWTPTSSQVGTFSVEVSVSDGTLSVSEIITVTVNSVLSVNHSIAEKLIVYPNPTSEQFEISSTGDIELEVYDLDGTMVKRAATNRPINIGDLKVGLYLIKVEDQVLKLMVNR